LCFSVLPWISWVHRRSKGEGVAGYPVNFRVFQSMSSRHRRRLQIIRIFWHSKSDQLQLSKPHHIRPRGCSCAIIRIKQSCFHNRTSSMLCVTLTWITYYISARLITACRQFTTCTSIWQYNTDINSSSLSSELSFALCFLQRWCVCVF